MARVDEVEKDLAEMQRTVTDGFKETNSRILGFALSVAGSAVVIAATVIITGR